MLAMFLCIRSSCNCLARVRSSRVISNGLLILLCCLVFFFYSFFAGEYSCLLVDLIFKREFSYYLIQIYIPCCMLVIVSWVSFWLDPNAIPARVSLGVTTLLTMATQISGINASLPPVSYTKAIDVWTGSCLTFVFGALLEFALVNYASRADAHRAAQKKQAAAAKKVDLEAVAAAASAMSSGAMASNASGFDPDSFESGPSSVLSFAKVEVSSFSFLPFASSFSFSLLLPLVLSLSFRLL